MLIDGARFLPSNATVTKVVASLHSSTGRLLAPPLEGVALPDGDAACPTYVAQGAYGAGPGGFDDATATLLFQVRRDRRNCCRVVGAL